MTASARDRDLGLLTACGLAMAAVAAAGLALPGSVFQYQFSFVKSDALPSIYRDWGGQGLVLPVLAGLALLFAFAVVLAGRVEGQEAASRALVIAAVLAAVFVTVYPSGSADLFRNIADSRTLWVYHENPRSVPTHKEDALYKQIAEVQRGGKAYYGLGTYVTYGPAALAGGDSVLGNLLAFKGLHAALLVGMVWLAGKCAESLATGRKVQAMVVLGWNPLVLYDGVANAHNDLLMGGFLLLACYFAARSPAKAGAAWAASAAVKYATALVAPVVLWWLWRRGSRLLAAAMVLAGTVTMVAILDGRRVTGFGIFVEFPTFRTLYSAIYYALEPSMGEGAVRLARYTSIGLFSAVTLGALAFTDGSTRALYRGCFWVTAAASVLMVTYFWPWYFLWFIPLGAVLAGGAEARVTVVASTVGLLFYATFPFADATVTLNYYMVAMLSGIPAAYAAIEMLGDRKKAPGLAPASV